MKNYLQQISKKEDIHGILLFSESVHDANMFYLTVFLSHDPFIYLMVQEKEIILVPTMEKERAKKESRVKDVRTLSDYGMNEKLEKYEVEKAYCELILELLNEEKISRIGVPKNFPIYIGDLLRERGIEIIPLKNYMDEMRAVKSEEEIKLIKKAQIACESAMESAIEIIKRGKVKDDVLIYSGEVLTSERVKSQIEHVLIDSRCGTEEPIVACGRDGADPHCTGSGPLYADEPIVIDIFPYLKTERYHSDMTRTVLKGEAKKEVSEMYEAVLNAQKSAISIIREGVTCSEVHNRVCDVFEEMGYDTIRKNAKIGFIHSTGHGIGLQLHEKPNLGENEYVLRKGNVVTVEPGLYYPDLGGVRIEDVVVIRKKGCEVLGRFKKELII
ncbi:MAG: M24 family metallopeptidase [Candidatus Syntropharchaeia archaeon]